MNTILNLHRIAGTDTYQVGWHTFTTELIPAGSRATTPGIYLDIKAEHLASSYIQSLSYDGSSNRPQQHYFVQESSIQQQFYNIRQALVDLFAAKLNPAATSVNPIFACTDIMNWRKRKCILNSSVEIRDAISSESTSEDLDLLGRCCIDFGPQNTPKTRGSGKFIHDGLRVYGRNLVMPHLDRRNVRTQWHWYVATPVYNGRFDMNCNSVRVESIHGGCCTTSRDDDETIPVATTHLSLMMSQSMRSLDMVPKKRSIVSYGAPGISPLVKHIGWITNWRGSRHSLWREEQSSNQDNASAATNILPALGSNGVGAGLIPQLSPRPDVDFANQRRTLQTDIQTLGEQAILEPPMAVQVPIVVIVRSGMRPARAVCIISRCQNLPANIREFASEALISSISKTRVWREEGMQTLGITHQAATCIGWWLCKVLELTRDTAVGIMFFNHRRVLGVGRNETHVTPSPSTDARSQPQPPNNPNHSNHANLPTKPNPTHSTCSYKSTLRSLHTIFPLLILPTYYYSSRNPYHTPKLLILHHPSLSLSLDVCFVGTLRFINTNSIAAEDRFEYLAVELGNENLKGYDSQNLSLVLRFSAPNSKLRLPPPPRSPSHETSLALSCHPHKHQPPHLSTKMKRNIVIFLIVLILFILIALIAYVIYYLQTRMAVGGTASKHTHAVYMDMDMKKGSFTRMGLGLGLGFAWHSGSALRTGWIPETHIRVRVQIHLLTEYTYSSAPFYISNIKASARLPVIQFFIFSLDSHFLSYYKEARLSSGRWSDGCSSIEEKPDVKKREINAPHHIYIKGSDSLPQNTLPSVRTITHSQDSTQITPRKFPLEYMARPSAFEIDPIAYAPIPLDEMKQSETEQPKELARRWDRGEVDS
ncbi:uncharacterized protein BDR25DRAFT_392866 [Lindgomyces ingoldianus]|uniref:Uncharacterized protein n=1 Tax=Lindgomyces ingoldianus TaxID=673940 RepID=A0ACB6R2B9_9PLEO|nr:uncharacterized protein BDR25DRAFT_392866 [Lindgomyces ingoldianus]KAF2472475.1 hypothetical protein BDR25DRAFT_392866 [Lindgomyces ingoldianus]